MSYEYFLGFYDRLMDFEFYDEWLEFMVYFIGDIFKKIFDLVCGIVEFVLCLSFFGY